MARILHIAAVLILSGFLSRAPTLRAEMRVWTDDRGGQSRAEFAGIEGGTVRLRPDGGGEITFPLERLSTPDREFIASREAAPGPRAWPDTVAVDSRSIEIRPAGDGGETGDFVYESESFEFTSQAKLAGSVMREVARTFEATKALVKSLPWGVPCRPPEEGARFQAALYETRERYIAAGGPENSGGVYMPGRKLFLIPFPSLGLELRGKTWFKDDAFTNDTLVHELTHQMMHEYLPFLPKWVIEGTAEYAELLPYNAGTFRASSHKPELKKHIDDCFRRGLRPDIGSVQEAMQMTAAAWDGESAIPRSQGMLYLRSLLLVYFFCHLDGDGDGARFLEFMDAVQADLSASRAFFADPRVEALGDGRFRFPSDLTPPDTDPQSAPFKHLDILTAGRGWEQLARDVVDAYRKIGEKVEAR